MPYRANSPASSTGRSSVASTGSPIYGRRSPTKSNAGSVTSSPKKQKQKKKTRK